MSGSEGSDDERSFNKRRRASTKTKGTMLGATGEEAAGNLDVLQDYQGRESCKEVTQLYRAANKLIKTMYLARQSILTGNDNIALLNYNEVASLFLAGKALKQDKAGVKQDMEQNLAICYNNIGCILLKQKNFRA